ncbi:1-deoxy-D-xylulose-5-phosphate reductoisomerase [Paenibacillus sp. GCM10012307]|uniref:1-deoxy-D-xylulose 5-phosphate reductoisomerase n=1 Tax=Paenibacillus roseus TaxID=2798579 RepID=A0A934MS04_9BACL|nr:1-deoxy-D-xylulose-5-phosphate reductoisomerase [Paenibacillus roseus]MBJ6363413.1 1-deoxy-D-xylulose-5-phosphate reductoisomerase [Paenibacillus roseus]
MKKISILGSTGSIGTQTLDVIASHPERFEVVALTAGSNVELLADQARRFRPRLVALADKSAAERVSDLLPPGTRIVYGEEGIIEAAADTGADLVITALVGSCGLRPTLAAIEAGITIGLANKETLVTAGHLVMQRAAEKNVAILPVDSEHSAIFQCLNGETSKEVRKIVITASGGSFRERTRQELEGVTIEQALNHPNWSMGAKITIDSATMVNKGLEVIEAHWLFGTSYDQIEVIIHPESIIHSFVEFVDYSIIAQLGLPDMRVPIQYALTYPERYPNPAKPLNLAEIGTLNFRPMDMERYPCMAMAFACGRVGGSAPTVFNAANEVAVARFLKGEISFLDIERVLEQVLERHQVTQLADVQAIEEMDAWARHTASLI